MTDDDESLRSLLREAVSDVAPHDRLADVRRRVRVDRPARRAGWAPILIGAGAVVATVALGAVLAGGILGTRGADPTGTLAPSPSVATADGDNVPYGWLAGLYFVGNTPDGPRLFREFQEINGRGTGAADLKRTLDRLTEDAGPKDPDYRTTWPAGAFESVEEDGSLVVVELADDAALDGPAGTSEAERWLGIQQVVYTVEAALGDAVPVQFKQDGAVTRQVLGIEVGPTVDRDKQYSTTNPVFISDPSEGDEVGDRLIARGATADYITEVRWWVSDATGTVVDEGGARPQTKDRGGTVGAPEWLTRIDLTEVGPGEYTLTAAVTGTGQTSDSPTEFTDTRTFVVR